MRDYIILQKDRIKVKFTINFEDFHVNIIDYVVEEESDNESVYLVRLEMELTSSNYKSDVKNLKATYDIVYDWRYSVWQALDFVIRDNEFTDSLYQLLESNAKESIVATILL